MSIHGDGGPAFPCGMSLLDWFAGHALAGWITGLHDAVDSYTGEPAAFRMHVSLVAQLCYDYAAAMLVERERLGNDDAITVEPTP